MGVVAKRTNPVFRELEFSVPPQTSREGRGAGDCVQTPMADDLISHSYVMKPP